MLLKVPRLLLVLSVVRPPLNPMLLKVPRLLLVLSLVLVEGEDRPLDYVSTFDFCTSTGFFVQPAIRVQCSGIWSARCGSVNQVTRSYIPFLGRSGSANTPTLHLKFCTGIYFGILACWLCWHQPLDIQIPLHSRRGLIPQKNLGQSQSGLI